MCLAGLFYFSLNQKKDLIKDYHEMREHLESIGCFKPSVCFYSLYFIHIILLEVIAYVVLIQFQLSCLTYLLSGFLIAAAQVSLSGNSEISLILFIVM